MNKPEAIKPSPKHDSGKRFKDMSPREKVVWVLKLAVCILTFGMAFPNVMSD
jgi:hypothetical protein